ncbi:PTS sugar transporter subunit IIC [Bifidobacterium stellenboschense]|uniref:Permease IIC component n=1 Tax=Bifidobacterium stellenboschense TaxID=762211 RepID=A0A087DRD6_9BIFI|nr:PTS sugar transporter subunit IIC [Bifidobacterium stellenboschense]KFI98086.1 PTS cellobiose transporter subunit IIC [Bifidobacterium stellenboschense]
MKEKMQAIGDAMLNGFMKFASLKALVALKDGFILTMPATLIGSLFLLIANLPFTGYADFMAKTFGDNWNIALNQVSTATFNILAIIVAVGIGYAYARNEKCDGISSGLLSLVTFFIVSPSSMDISIDPKTIDIATDATKNAKDVAVSGVFVQNWTGSNGIISAIIMGLIVGWIYTACIKHDVKIKMPDSVPQGVTNAFSALIPGLIVITGSSILYHVCKVFGGVSLTELIFKVLQIPLQSLTDTWAGAIIIALLISMLFWCGIHGANVVSGVVTPLLTANTLVNQSLLDKGIYPSKANGGHYLTPQVIDCFVKFSGVGLTVGLLIAALLFARSKQLREVSKLSIVPGIFGINEPVIFGLPIVFNPIMLIPFVVTPLCAMILMYGCLSVGFIQPFGAVQVPWTTPPIISGFILGGWKCALLQVIIAAMAVAIYYPFVKMQDKIYLEQEAEAESAE